MEKAIIQKPPPRARIIGGNSDANVRFEEFRRLLREFSTGLGVISVIMRSAYVDLEKKGIRITSPGILRERIDSLCEEYHCKRKPDIPDKYD